MKSSVKLYGMVDFDSETLSAINKSAADAMITTLISTGMLKSPKTAHKRINWERIIAREWGEKFYQNVPKWYRVEVGAIPGGQNENLYSRTRRYADLVIHLPEETLIVEFKMRAIPDVVAQLQNYKLLLPQTPMFEKYAKLPIRLILVCCLIDDATREFVESAEIEVIMFKPSNFEDWYKYVVEKNRDYQNSK